MTMWEEKDGKKIDITIALEKETKINSVYIIFY
jgi:hypothetical protein